MIAVGDKAYYTNTTDDNIRRLAHGFPIGARIPVIVIGHGRRITPGTENKNAEFRKFFMVVDATGYEMEAEPSQLEHTTSWLETLQLAEKVDAVHEYVALTTNLEQIYNEVKIALRNGEVK